MFLLNSTHTCVAANYLLLKKNREKNVTFDRNSLLFMIYNYFAATKNTIRKPHTTLSSSTKPTLLTEAPNYKRFDYIHLLLPVSKRALLFGFSIRRNE